MKILFRTTLIICLYFSAYSFSFSQLDLSIQYQRPTFGDWDQVIHETYRDEVKFFANAYGIGAGYRYYPWDFRLGFIPELSFNYLFEERQNNFYQASYQMIQLSVGLPVQVFPFDFYGDCNCPTFGKQNDFLQKSIYFKFIPEIGYQLFKYTAESSSEANNIAFLFGAGIGMNIALSELITIAPELSYHIILNEKWDGLASHHNQAAALDMSTANTTKFSLRFSFYFNQ